MNALIYALHARRRLVALRLFRRRRRCSRWVFFRLRCLFLSALFRVPFFLLLVLLLCFRWRQWALRAARASVGTFLHKAAMASGTANIFQPSSAGSTAASWASCRSWPRKLWILKAGFAILWGAAISIKSRNVRKCAGSLLFRS